MDLTLTHPDYVATCNARHKSRHLYEGNDVVKCHKEKYLFKEPNEDDDNYCLRLKRAVLDPYVEKIVGWRHAVQFDKPHTRTLPSALNEYLDDVDLKGTPAEVFFGDAAREAQIDGIHWVCIDMPRLPEDGAYASALAEKRANHRPFFEHVPANNVIDWSVNELDRELEWAVVSQCAQRSARQPGVAADEYVQYKIWTRDHWQLYETGQNEKLFTLVAEGANPTGVVPLVPFYGIKRNDFSGWPVARSVLDHIILIYNKESDCDWFQRLTAHPIPYVVSPEKPTKMDVAKGLHVKSHPQGAQIELGYLEITGTAFESNQTSIESLQRKIFLIALAQAKKETAQVQSGESQREDRKIFTSSLKNTSILYQHSEQRCWQMMAAWTNLAPQGIEISYNRDFDDQSIDATMLSTLGTLVDSNCLTKRTLLNIMKDGETLPAYVDVDEELKALQEQDRQAAEATLLALKHSAHGPADNLPGEG